MKNNIESVLLFQVDKTSKVSKIYTQREFDRLGLEITVDQWVLLKIIHENEGISQKDLAGLSFRDPASITRTLKLLGKRGLIKKEVIPDNLRQHAVFLTGEGQEFIQANMPLVLEHRKKSMDGLTNVEVQLLMDLLKKIQDNMS